MINIHMCKIKRKHVENPAIYQNKFVVVANQIVGTACDDDPCVEKPQFQLTKAIGSAPVDISDQRGDLHSSCGRGLQSIFNVLAVGAKNSNLYPLLRAIDSG